MHIQVDLCFNLSKIFYLCDYISVRCLPVYSFTVYLSFYLTVVCSLIHTCTYYFCLTSERKQNDNNLFVSVVLGYLPVKISCAAAASRNSDLKAPQKARERVNRYMTDLACDVLQSSKFEICSSKGIADFSSYLLETLQVLVERVEPSSIKITVNCRTQEILDRLWNDYQTGHLNKVAEECLITDKVKEELDMETIKLATSILEEDYSACKLSLIKISGTFLFDILPSVPSPM